MATGDSNDVLMRVKRLLPRGWFAWTAPLRDAVIGGLSDGASVGYSWITFAQSQARIATASGIFLDIIAFDFLGRNLLRNGSSDSVFRSIIVATILKERVTRLGMINALTALTGSAPKIFEPWNTFDAGAYGVAASGIGYGVGGGWGSMILPGQVFIQSNPGLAPLTPNIGGYGNYPGGYGTGSDEYITTSQEAGTVEDAVIFNMITTTKPTGVIAWTAIS
jgi:hypothetical protein